jgi:outer membrane receptor for ferrienterochelin and colicins
MSAFRSMKPLQTAVMLVSLMSSYGWPEAAPSCFIIGQVHDQEGLPVPGVTVRLEPSGLEVLTDDTGLFAFHELNEGHYRLTAILNGFHEERLETRLTLSGTSRLKFILKPTFSDTITVGVNRDQKQLERSPVRIEALPADLIRKTAARSLADALEFASGLQVESNCQNCNFSQLRMLGLDGAYSQILIDGQPVISSLAQVYAIEQIPTRMIERIEVIKGGGSVVYAGGSIAGVVNVIPREPSATGGEIESRLEWMNGLPNYAQTALFDFVSQNRRTSLTGFGQMDRILPLDRDGDGFTEVSRRQFGALGARLTHWLLPERGKLTFDLGKVLENRRGGNRLDEPEHFADIAESARTRRDTLSTNWIHVLTPKLDYRAGFSVSQTRRDTYYGSRQDPNAYGNTTNPLLVFDSQLNHYRSNHVLSWGVQHSSDHLTDEQPSYHRYTDDVYRNSGFFMQDAWSFSKGWEALYGIRFDKHSEIKGAVLSPRVALKWSPTAQVNLRGSLARGFRPPQVFDEDLHITQVGGVGAVIRNAPDLTQENGTSYMIGGEWTPSWAEHSALFEINTFNTRLTDLFKVVDADQPETTEFEFLRINLGEARVLGIEVNAGYGFGQRFKIEGGHVHQRGRYDRPEPDFGATRFLRTPSSHSSVTLTWFVPRFAEVFFGIRRSGGMLLPHYAGYIPESRLESTKGFAVCNASLSRTITRLPRDSSLVLTGARIVTPDMSMVRGFHGPSIPVSNSGYEDVCAKTSRHPMVRSSTVVRHSRDPRRRSPHAGDGFRRRPPRIEICTAPEGASRGSVIGGGPLGVQMGHRGAQGPSGAAAFLGNLVRRLHRRDGRTARTGTTLL